MVDRLHLLILHLSSMLSPSHVTSVSIGIVKPTLWCRAIQLSCLTGVQLCMLGLISPDAFSAAATHLSVHSAGRPNCSKGMRIISQLLDGSKETRIKARDAAMIKPVSGIQSVRAETRYCMANLS